VEIEVKTLEEALAELERSVEAAPYAAPGAPPPSLTVQACRKDVIRDRAGRIAEILEHAPDGSMTRKLITRDADHRISRIDIETEGPL
jgi:hypothetical protein